ncbi:hypothetical protein BOW41_12535 [Solemya velum gill symbiont]|uniref:autotransporter domain-containing protein n=1 Tax=Solemya velum gill symbiont TaxID=2340 RepID=UPI0009961AD3|nr:autotransporter domain-containing protein [Solemya velum gill symbiont]OOZ52381.1 hypothetical protein BOW41_12535 [Solemya velum gill symbiont]
MNKVALYTIGVALVVSSSTNSYSADIKGVVPADPKKASVGSGISGDGKVVIGSIGNTIFSNGPVQYESFAWTEDGISMLGMISGDSVSQAYDASFDGSVVVGASQTFDDSPSVNLISEQAFKWTEAGGMITFPNIFDDQINSNARGVSSDGKKIVVNAQSSSQGKNAYLWDENDGIIRLGHLGVFERPANYITNATAISGDGSTVVGTSRTNRTITQAFRWTESSGMVGLGFLGDGGDDKHASFARAASHNGGVIVGFDQNLTTYDREAFKYTNDTGMISLGDLDGGATQSVAYDVSANGDVIVGVGTGERNEDLYGKKNADVFAQHAIVWINEEIFTVEEWLNLSGVDTSNWHLSEANGVSDDGSVISGYGIFDAKIQRAFVARDGGLMSSEMLIDSIHTIMPATESSHGMTREQLDTQRMIGQHYQCAQGSTCMYASGFGGEWNSYTLGGGIGVAWQASETVKVGGGFFTGQYKDNDLNFKSEYDLRSQGISAWLNYQPAATGLQANVAALYAKQDNKIERDYLNGATLEKSKGNPDGSVYGATARLGWVVGMNEQTNVTPFLDYTWTHVEIDGYTEEGGAFPAYVNEREDDAHTIRVGLEADTNISKILDVWGQLAYGKRLDDDSVGISGKFIGLMDFSHLGYSVDEDWIEMDIGARWRVGETTNIVATVGGTINNQEQPNWRASLGLTLDL